MRLRQEDQIVTWVEVKCSPEVQVFTESTFAFLEVDRYLSKLRDRAYKFKEQRQHGRS